MKFKKEIKIGIVVTLIIFLFLWGYNFLKGRNLFSSYNYYYAVFSNISGLQKSSSVAVNGFTVGLVSDIGFTSDKLDKLYVEIGVKKDFKVPDNSIISVEGDLLGSQSIVLILGDSKRIAENGDTLPGSMAPGLMGAVSDKLMPIAENADKLIVSIDSVLQILQYTFDDKTQKNIQSIIAEAEGMISTERKKISRMLTNFESVSNNLKSNNEDITKIISNLSTFSQTLANPDLNAAITNANKSMEQLNSITASISQGEGTLGQLTKNDSAYIYLQRSLEDLDKLLVDLKENPKRYVHFSLFGKKNK